MLEPKTLIVVMVLTELLVGLSVLFALRGRYGSGALQWVTSHFLQVLAISLFAMRAQLPMPMYLLVYSAATAGTYSLGLVAYARLGSQTVPRFAVWGPVLVAPVVFLLLGNNTAWRIVAGSLIFGVQQLLILRCLRQTSAQAFGSSRSLALLGHAVVVSLLLVRMGYALWFPERIAAGDPWLTQLTMMVGYCTLIVLAFAYLLMLRDQLDGVNQRLAQTDALTGALNRRAFFDRAQAEWARGKRHPQGTGVLMLDIDHFKRINDTYGHASGDAALVKVAHAVQGGLRKHDLFGRYGGEEFIALMPQTPKADVLRIAERLRKIVESGSGHSSIALPAMTISIGVSWSQDCDSSLEESVALADKALYLAKASGRNRVCDQESVPCGDKDGANATAKMSAES